MSYLVRAFLALAVLLGGVSAQAAVPDRAWGHAVIGQDAPMWVSEEFAIVEGELQRQHFHPDILRRVESQLTTAREKNRNACEVYAESMTKIDRESRGSVSMQSIQREAEQVLSGQIGDIKQGFLYGKPGTMIEVLIDHDALAAPEDRVVYIFLHLAKLKIEGVYLCSGLADGRSSPQIGASTILALDERIESGRSLGLTESGYAIAELAAHEVLIADALSKDYKANELDVDHLRRGIRSERRPR